jgi:hypothetical protein
MRRGTSTAALSYAEKPTVKSRLLSSHSLRVQSGDYDYANAEKDPELSDAMNERDATPKKLQMKPIK